MISQLKSVNVLTPSSKNDDLALTEEFRSDWRRRIDQIADDPPTYLGLLVDADPESLAIDESDDGLTVRDDSEAMTRTVGEWPSEAAMVADIAAFVMLGEWLPEWESFEAQVRDELVARLRVFLNACPICDGALEHTPGESEDAVPSVRCGECGMGLL